MLAANDNKLVFANTLEKHSVIQVSDFVRNCVQSRKIVTLLTLEVSAVALQGYLAHQKPHPPWTLP